MLFESPKAIEVCEACDGTGHYWRHCPQHDDPYLMIETRDPCEECAGFGYFEVEAPELEESDE